MNKEYDLNLQVSHKKKQLNLKELLPTEKIFRLNPHAIIEEFSEENDGFSLQLGDHAKGTSATLQGQLLIHSPTDITLTMTGGDYHSLRIFLNGDTFKASVQYAEEEIDENLEYNIVMWLRGIKEYLRLYLTNSPNALLFRFIMNRVILKMTPSQRKISLMLIRITVLEIVAILVIVIGYFFFMRN